MSRISTSNGLPSEDAGEEIMTVRSLVCPNCRGYRFSKHPVMTCGPCVEFYLKRREKLPVDKSKEIPVNFNPGLFSFIRKLFGSK